MSTTFATGWRGDALAALSGVLLALSFPKFGHWSLAWVALAPLLLAVQGAPSGRAAFRRGYLAGAVSSMGLVYWTEAVVVQFGGLPLVVGLLVMTLLCLALALFPSLFAWAVWRWTRWLGGAALLLAPFAWVATEILRAHILFRFSWCLLGYSQQPFPALHPDRALRSGLRWCRSWSRASSARSRTWRSRRAPRARGTGRPAVTAVLVWAVGIHGSWMLGQPGRVQRHHVRWAWCRRRSARTRSGTRPGLGQHRPAREP